jgi:hypothetical protein
MEGIKGLGSRKDFLAFDYIGRHHSSLTEGHWDKVLDDQNRRFEKS